MKAEIIKLIFRNKEILTLISMAILVSANYPDNTFDMILIGTFGFILLFTAFLVIKRAWFLSKSGRPIL
jgi:energy-coupling factor transporter transmembrane protein EcfT